jgi:uncharacterized delta-60 repeat protein
MGPREGISHLGRLARFARQGTTLIVLVALARLASPSLAQCTGHWLPGQGVPGVQGYVYAFATLPDGDVIVGGVFTIAGNIFANSIARYNPTTGNFAPLGGGVSFDPQNGAGQVRAIVTPPNGDLIVGGSFSLADGSPADSIARYSPTTNHWSRLAPSPPSGGIIRAMALLPDGTLLVGGSFGLDAAGPTISCIERYDLSSNTWSYADHAQSSQTATVTAFALLPGGDVLVGGRFSLIGGTSANNIARFTPSTGQWAPLGLGISGASAATAVDALAILPDGDILVGGSFQSAGIFGAASLARYNPNSGSWSSFATGVGGISTPVIFSLVPLPGGEVLVGGRFTNAGDSTANSIAVFNPDTQAWRSLGSGGLGLGGSVTFLSNFVYTTTVLPNGDVLAGGLFISLGSSDQGILRYSSATQLWSPPLGGTSGPVTPIVLPNGEVYVTGQFSVIQGTPANTLARYSPTTSTFTSMGLGPSDSVTSIARLPDGDLAALGSIHLSSGATATSARFHQATGEWSSLIWPLQSSGNPILPTAMAQLPGGDIVVSSSSLDSAAGVPVNHFARWNVALSTWSDLGYSGNDTPTLFLGFPSGDVALGWSYVSSSSPLQYSLGVVRYVAASGTWSNIAAVNASNAYVSLGAIAADPTTGDAIIGGYFQFNTPGGPAQDIMRVNAAGAQTAMGAGADNSINSVAVLPSGDIIASGYFTQIGGQSINSLARYNPTRGTWSPLGLGIDGSAAIAALPNGDLLAGGSFTTAGGQLSAYIARYSFAQACPADIDCSGAVEVADIFAFINDWFANDPAADFNRANGIEVQDIFDFLNAWFAGC